MKLTNVGRNMKSADTGDKEKILKCKTFKGFKS
jgi:hypothetical protein